MPEGFEWTTIDLADDNEAQELYQMLKDHYVEDSGGNFRFDYPIPLIRWVLMPPNYKKDWHVAIRSKKDGKLLAFVSGTPVKTRVNG